MSKPNIEVTIEPDGTIITKVIGGRGWTCRDATKALREALGTTVEDKTLPEFFQTVTTGATVKQGGK